MNTKTFLATLSLFACLHSSAQLQFMVRSLDVDTELRPGLMLRMQLDGEGLKQGEMSVYERRLSRQKTYDSTRLFYGHFVDDKLNDTAWFYNPLNQTTRTAVFSADYFHTYATAKITSRTFTFSVNGVRNGKDITWKAGEVQSSGNYAKGKETGLFISNYTSGRSETMYEEGLKHGKITQWNEQGEKIVEGFYKNGNSTGEWKYYSQGKLSTSHTCYDCETDTVRYYFPDGKLSAQSTSSYGTKVGDERSYHENGQLSSYRHYNSEGVSDSLFFVYHENGRLIYSAPYVNGEFNGKTESWHSNGKKESLGTMREGVYHGAYTEWHPNGKIKAKGTYDSGMKTGEWRYYDEKGKQIPEESPDYDLTAGTEDAMMPIEAEEPAQKLEIRLPDNTLLKNTYKLNKKQKLRFVRKYDEIQIEGKLSKEGTVTYKIITPLKPKEAAALSALLAQNTQWTRLIIASTPSTATIHLTLQWNYLYSL